MYIMNNVSECFFCICFRKYLIQKNNFLGYILQKSLYIPENYIPENSGRLFSGKEY